MENLSNMMGMSSYPTVLGYVAYLFLFVVGSFCLFLVFIYISDKTQKKSTLRRNYPVIARFRYFFEHIGEFFRQYFFALDRDELPFNRAERSWCYRAAKDVDSTVAFGSTKCISRQGTVLFANAAFPVLKEEIENNQEITIGEYAKNPYKTNKLVHISGMSFGAISIPAVRALANGARKAGIWMNTGEGGLSPYHLEGGCDIVFQIGTAKFGVRDKDGNLSLEKIKEVASKEQVKMFEIKLSQGAKPGKGGILPAAKITDEIANIRGVEKGKDAISPNRHKDIANISDLLDVINKVRDSAGKPVGFKSVFGSFAWLEELCEEVNKRGIEFAPDFITIDSSDGGTGAAPLSLIDSMGLPLKVTLPQVVEILKKYNLKERIKIITSGKLINPSEAAWSFAMGADFVVSARGFMFALGCIQALQCNKNTCPTGITTHNKKLQYGLDPEDKAVRVMNYSKNLEKELGFIANSCGVTQVRGLQKEHIRIVGDSNSLNVA